jgi:hypothetical protein
MDYTLIVEGPDGSVYRCHGCGIYTGNTDLHICGSKEYTISRKEFLILKKLYIDLYINPT